jgi:hypothetical protein
MLLRRTLAFLLILIRSDILIMRMVVSPCNSLIKNLILFHILSFPSNDPRV